MGWMLPQREDNKMFKGTTITHLRQEKQGSIIMDSPKLIWAAL